MQIVLASSWLIAQLSQFERLWKSYPYEQDIFELKASKQYLPESVAEMLRVGELFILGIEDLGVAIKGEEGLCLCVASGMLPARELTNVVGK